MTFDLSVGQVAGLIALTIVLVQSYIPNIMIFILSSRIGNENTATTWSVLARSVLRSNWPTILRCESAATKPLRWSIFIITAASPVLAAFLTVAGVITPLGLYNDVVPGSTQRLSFQYIHDDSPFSTNTTYLKSTYLNRRCFKYSKGAKYWVPCPHVPQDYSLREVQLPTATTVMSSTTPITKVSGTPTVTTVGNTAAPPHPPQTTISIDPIETSYHEENNLAIDIPKTMRDRYTSGIKSMSSTISSVFDIQWRKQNYLVQKHVNLDKPFLQGTFRPIQPMLLSKNIYLIEGLLVDPLQGWIAFRNHTAPTGLKHGALWSEDLLSLSPKTECINLNFTLDYSKPIEEFSTSKEGTGLYLTYYGPWPTESLHEYDPTQHEIDPNDVDLRTRALKAGKHHNKLLEKLIRGRSRGRDLGEIGTHFNSSVSLATNKSVQTGVDTALTLKSSFSEILEMFNFELSKSFQDHLNNETTLLINSCQNLSTFNPRKSYSPAIICGILRGPSRMTQVFSVPGTGGSATFQQFGMPLYSCASSVVADIKEVSFSVTGSEPHNLQDIKVLNVSSKQYGNNSPTPLWGVEDLNLSDFQSQPLWGIIDNNVAELPDVWSVRKPVFFLPGTVYSSRSPLRPAGLGLDNPGENFPGIDLVGLSLTSLYQIDSNINKPNNLPYYTGLMSGPLESEWIASSKFAQDAATIPNRIWADIVANAVTSTRDVSGSGSNKDVFHLGKAMYETVRMKYLYAIPAFVIALLVLLINAFAALIAIKGAGKIEDIRRLLRQSSTGRIMTASDGIEGGSLKAKEWAKTAGTKIYDLSGNRPLLKSIDDDEKTNTDRHETSEIETDDGVNESSELTK